MLVKHANYVIVLRSKGHCQLKEESIIIYEEIEEEGDEATGNANSLKLRYAYTT